MKKTVIISKQKDCDYGLIALRNNSIPACFSPRQLFPLLDAFSLAEGMNKKEGERHEKDSDYF